MKKIALAALLGLGTALAAGSLATPASAQQVLRIGTEAAYKPFAYVLPSGELTGFDIDITKALCEQMQVKCKIINQSYDGLIPALLVKKIDAIIASMSITPEREKTIAFAGPYYSAPALFAGPKGKNITISEDGLKGLVVGVQRGTTMADYMAKNLPGVKVQFYDTLDNSTLDLTSGRIDVVFADAVVLDEWLKSAQGARFAAIGDPIYDPATLGVGAGIGLRKADTELKDKFNAALKELLASGKYAEINKRYIPIDIAPRQ